MKPTNDNIFLDSFTPTKEKFEDYLTISKQLFEN